MTKPCVFTYREDPNINATHRHCVTHGCDEYFPVPLVAEPAECGHKQLQRLKLQMDMDAMQAQRSILADQSGNGNHLQANQLQPWHNVAGMAQQYMGSTPAKPIPMPRKSTMRTLQERLRQASQKAFKHKLCDWTDDGWQSDVRVTAEFAAGGKLERIVITVADEGHDAGNVKKVAPVNGQYAGTTHHFSEALTARLFLDNLHDHRYHVPKHAYDRLYKIEESAKRPYVAVGDDMGGFYAAEQADVEHLKVEAGPVTSPAEYRQEIREPGKNWIKRLFFGG